MSDINSKFNINKELNTYKSLTIQKREIANTIAHKIKDLIQEISKANKCISDPPTVESISTHLSTSKIIVLSITSETIRDTIHTSMFNIQLSDWGILEVVHIMPGFKEPVITNLELIIPRIEAINLLINHIQPSKEKEP